MCRASVPVAASPTTSNPSSCNSIFSPCRNIAWSSASNTCTGPVGAGSAPGISVCVISCLYESPAHGVAHQAGGLVDLEFLHDAGAMRVRGLHAQAQYPGDLTGGLALGDELQHLALAVCEGIRREFGLADIGVHHGLG